MSNHMPWEDQSIAVNGLRVCDNFKNWFARSQATTDDGLPLIAYHGSGSDIGDSFRPCSFFSPRIDVAEIYAKAPTRQTTQAGPNITPVYLALCNPYVFDNALINDNLSHHVLGRRGRLVQVREKLLVDGYDSIIWLNYLDLGGIQTQYVIFDAWQAKSVLGNSGLYLRGPSLTDRSEEEALLLAKRAMDACDPLRLAILKP